MHPIEHVVYFSVVLIHFVVPSHPIHFIFNSQHTALTPSGGHHGYEGPILNGAVPTGSYFHYLHHRYFVRPRWRAAPALLRRGREYRSCTFTCVQMYSQSTPYFISPFALAGV